VNPSPAPVLTLRLERPGFAALFLDNRPVRGHNTATQHSAGAGNALKMFTLDDLARIIAARAEVGAEASYTSSLLAKGPPQCAKKFGEEAVELAIATVAQDAAAVRAEAADVLYHLLVVLKSRGVALSEVMGELERRTAQGGHAEKASRLA
jgi:phosphoribosyl-ATP pyrophosphohydrolase